MTSAALRPLDLIAARARSAIGTLIMIALPVALIGAAALAIFGTPRRAPRKALRDVVELELQRARRYNGHFSIVRLPEPSPIPLLPGKTIRINDAAVSEAPGEFVVLPEADRTAADGLLRRMFAGVEASDVAGVATFPHDGITVEALRAALKGADHFAQPLPRSYAESQPEGRGSKPDHDDRT